MSEDRPEIGFMSIEQEKVMRSVAKTVNHKPLRSHWVSAQSWLTLYGSSDQSDTIIRDKLHSNLVESKSKTPQEQQLAKKELITFSSVLAFSALIGNTDMSLGNLSLEKVDNKGAGHDYRISDYYDIEPYILRSGELRPDYLENKKLSDLKELNDLPYTKGSISMNAFKNGLKLREVFIKEVAKLARDKKITQSDYNVFMQEFDGCLSKDLKNTMPNKKTRSPSL